MDVELSDVASILTAGPVINENFEKIQAALSTALDRTDPKQLEDDLNLNGFRIQNIGDGVEETDAASVRQLNEVIFGSSLYNSLSTRISALENKTDSIEKFGGSTAATAEVNNAAVFAAMVQGSDLFIPKGTYRISTGVLKFIFDNQRIYGQGEDSILMTTDTIGDLIGCPFGRTGIVLENIRLVAPSNATAGAVVNLSGIAASGCKIDVRIDGGYDGLLLGVTDFSTLKYKVRGQARHAVRMTALGASQGGRGELQWQIESGSLSGRCGGDALGVVGVSGGVQVTLGQWFGPQVFAATGYGIYIQGTADCPINDLNCLGGFSGETGNSCVYIETYGGKNNSIVGMKTELAGRSPTGPLLATTASNLGCGFEIGGFTPEMQLVGVLADNCSYEGIASNAALTDLDAVKATGNGLANVSGRRSNIYHNGGKMRIGSAFLDGRGVTQFGVYTYDGSKLAIGGISAGRHTIADVGAFANFGSVVGPTFKQVYP